MSIREAEAKLALTEAFQVAPVPTQPPIWLQEAFPFESCLRSLPILPPDLLLPSFSCLCQRFYCQVPPITSCYLAFTQMTLWKHFLLGFPKIFQLLIPTFYQCIQTK